MWSSKARASSLAVAAAVAAAGAVGCGATTTRVRGGVTIEELDPPPAGDSTTSSGSTTSTAGSAPDGVRPTMLAAGLLDGEPALDEARIRWHAEEAADFDAWFEIAVLANRGRPLDGADELMVDALERAVSASACAPDRLGKVRLLAIAVRFAADHATDLDPSLDRLADVGPTECAAWPPLGAHR